MATTKKTSRRTNRFAIVADNGRLVWTAYDTWTTFDKVRNPRLYDDDDLWAARHEAMRAKAYADDDKTLPNLEVKVVAVMLSFGTEAI